MVENTKRDMAVLSVRLPVSEIARLESIGHEKGKNLSQVVRDAIAVYRTQKPTTSVMLEDGVTIRFGKPDKVSFNVPCEVVCSDVRTFATGAAEPMMIWDNSSVGNT